MRRGRIRCCCRLSFNKLREFLGKLKKDRVSKGRQGKGVNADLELGEKEAPSQISNNQTDPAALRLKISKLKATIRQLKVAVQEKEEEVFRVKSKVAGEVGCLQRLRKQLYGADQVIKKLKAKMEKENIALGNRQNDQKLIEMMREMDEVIVEQQELEKKEKQARKDKVEQQIKHKRDTMYQRIEKNVTTKIPSSYTPEKYREILLSQKRGPFNKSDTMESQSQFKITPSEFKLFDNRIDYQVDDTLNDTQNKFNDSEDGENKKVEGEGEENSKVEVAINDEPQILKTIKPIEFKITDDRIDFKIDAENSSDNFSQTDLSRDEEGQNFDGLIEYEAAIEGDENINVASPPSPLTKEALIQTSAPSSPSANSPQKEEVDNQPASRETSPNIKDLVSATISAWNTNPSIVKKELDKQYATIQLYKEKCKDLQYQLDLRGKEFEKRLGLDNYRDLQKRKSELERENMVVLEREKKRVVEVRLREMHRLKRYGREGRGLVRIRIWRWKLGG